MDPLSAGIIAGGSTIAGIAGGAMSAHSSRKIQAHEHRWQEKMRATAYQTAVDDLQKAGLNPAMAYMNSGASAGVGSGMTSGGNYNIDPKLHEALTAKQELEGMKKQNELLEEQKNNIQEETKGKKIENKINSLTIPSVENKANSDKTIWGKYIRPYLNDAGTIIDGVSRLAMPFAGATTAKRALNAIGKARPTVQNNYYSK